VNPTTNLHIMKIPFISQFERWWLNLILIWHQKPNTAESYCTVTVTDYSCVYRFCMKLLLLIIYRQFTLLYIAWIAGRQSSIEKLSSLYTCMDNSKRLRVLTKQTLEFLFLLLGFCPEQSLITSKGVDLWKISFQLSSHESPSATLYRYLTKIYYKGIASRYQSKTIPWDESAPAWTCYSTCRVRTVM